MELELTAKLAIYQHFAALGQRPSVAAIATRVGATVPKVCEVFSRLQAPRVLALEPDAAPIRTPPPSSGVPTRPPLPPLRPPSHPHPPRPPPALPTPLHRPPT